jgi:FMN phosphatase YigB (HAD superfamily)
MSAGAAGVTFDLWHTLLYLDPDAEETYMRRQVEVAVDALRELPARDGGPARPDGELRAAFEREYRAAIEAAAEGRSVPPAIQFQRAARSLGREEEPRDYLQRLRALVDATTFRVGPGSLELLGELRGGGYRIAVISNTIGESGAYFRERLHDFEFDRYVRVYAFSDELPWTKPAPEIFRHTLAELGVDPARALHVGDGRSDIEGAKRAGMRAGILFTGLQNYGAQYAKFFQSDDWERPAPDWCVHRLSELAPLVRRLLPHAAP